RWRRCRFSTRRGRRRRRFSSTPTETGAYSGGRMDASVREILDDYDAKAPLEEAWTIPAPWYVDGRIAELERRTVFSNSWQPIGRLDQLAQPGQYVTAMLAGEPIVVVRGEDGTIRGFFNVCRHHAASVMTEPEGKAPILRCPYHGWTYSLAGELKGTP